MVRPIARGGCRRLGFTDIIRRYHFAGDPRAFAILGRALPL
jgi:hypothetical protein